MPIIDIKANRNYPKAQVRAAIGAGCRAVAKALGIKPGQVWMRFQPGRPEHYWEGDGKKIKPRAVPLLVFVHMARGRPSALRRAIQRELTAALATNFKISPDAVWMRIEELDLTHVSQGGVSYDVLRG